MDMYQKRKQRKEKAQNKNDNTSKTNINWDISTYSKNTLKLYKIRVFA